MRNQPGYGAAGGGCARAKGKAKGGLLLDMRSLAKGKAVQMKGNETARRVNGDGWIIARNVLSSEGKGCSEMKGKKLEDEKRERLFRDEGIETGGRWKVEGGRWEGEGGRWKVEVEGGRGRGGRWKVRVGKVEGGKVDGRWKVKGGRVEVVKWKVEVEGGRWKGGKVEGGRWEGGKVEGWKWKGGSGRWKVEGEGEGGRWKVEGRRAKGEGEGRRGGYPKPVDE
ncbi:hypothetical protein BU15DRAFT_68499 [Melanogaster broomeanus]|nr:hypothetical protein BU15DRAFT_68499 [Melanogaster broomeanus]